MRALILMISTLTACAAPLQQQVPATTPESTTAASALRAQESSARSVTRHRISLVRGSKKLKNLAMIVSAVDDPRRMWIDKSARKKLTHFLRDRRHKAAKRIPERLLWYLYLVAQHFDAPLEIVSGYRSRERKSSRHAHMRAVDFRIPGVSAHDVWHYCKRFDNVGLGWYPTSKFVHLDVRDKTAYWIDDSGPGQRSRYRRKVPQDRPKKRRRL